MSSDNVLSRFAESLEGLPRMVASALNKRSTDIQTRVENEIDRIVSEFDIEEAIRKAAEPLLRNALTIAVEKHFESRSGQQSITDHIEKVLTTRPVTENLDINLSSHDKVESPSRPFFSDPLTLDQILQRIGTNHPFPNMSLSAVSKTVSECFENGKPDDYAIIVTPTDALALQNHPFDAYFDPIHDKQELLKGRLGTIMDMEVYGDGYLDVENRFITQSGLIERPKPVVTSTEAETPPVA